MADVVYWQHDASGDFYAIELEGDAVIGVCGPLPWDEVTNANRESHAFDFDTDPEEIAWATNAAFHLVTDNLPGDRP